MDKKTGWRGEPTTDELTLVIRILAKLVTDEYPDGRTLAEIVRQWTSYDSATIAAVERVERIVSVGR